MSTSTSIRAASPSRPVTLARALAISSSPYRCIPIRAGTSIANPTRTGPVFFHIFADLSHSQTRKLVTTRKRQGPAPLGLTLIPNAQGSSRSPRSPQSLSATASADCNLPNQYFPDGSTFNTSSQSPLPARVMRLANQSTNFSRAVSAFILVLLYEALPSPHSLHSSRVQKVAKHISSTWMPESTEGFGFDLPNPLAGQTEHLPNFFQRRPVTGITQTESEA